MISWPKYPIIYEINTWVWLHELSRLYNRLITLATVPSEEWDALSSLGVDAIWFMGVWERSPAGTRIALNNEVLMADFRRALPDLQPEDIVGSPYCIRRYVVDEHLGGPEGLAAAREELVKRGILLVLDFVPNHLAPDHPWVLEHPEFFIQGDAEDLRKDPSAFVEAGGKVFACGRDPYFPAWQDVVQVNAFHPELRKAVIQTVSQIAGQCDGVRCDMAMLVMNNIFERTWGHRAGRRPAVDYWTQVILSTRGGHPGFKFIAEAYWDLEWELQELGFDFCYDKRLYDRLAHGNAESVRLHLHADLGYQNKLVRFIENHDEPRAAATFSSAKNRAAALAVSTLPGALLLHEGQLEGRKVRLPVFLGRRPDEPADGDLRHFYRMVVRTLRERGIREGAWSLCDVSGWTDNRSFLNLVAWCWTAGDKRHLMVVNLSGARSQGLIRTACSDLRGRTVVLRDVLSGEAFERSGDELYGSGLYVDLDGWGYHFFEFAG